MEINQPFLTATAHWKRDIVLFLSGQTISLFGSSLVQFAIIWHITLTTSSGLMVTISTLCGFLPQLLISLCLLYTSTNFFESRSNLYSTESTTAFKLALITSDETETVVQVFSPSVVSIKTRTCAAVASFGSITRTL